MSSILFHVKKTGISTSFQDYGRYGYQRLGVVAAGAMDQTALQWANLLVGNPRHSACMEICILGPTLIFQSVFTFAICGANLSPRINGSPISCWRTYTGQKGDILTFGERVEGNYAYLAVSGGFNCKKVLGSQSSYAKAEFASIIEKDSPILGFPRKLGMNRGLISSIIPEYKEEVIVQYIYGPHLSYLDKESTFLFENQTYTFELGDRMGYRFNGKELLNQDDSAALLPTGPIPLGGIQIPPDGNPIVLLADRQTTGGYPLLGTVITSDLPKLVQLRLKGTVRFKGISIQRAQEKYRYLNQQFHVLQSIM